MKALLILLPLLLLSACYTPRRASKSMDKAFDLQRPVTARKCATWYPPVVKDSTSFIYMPGTVTMRTDTTVLRDTVNNVETRYIDRWHEQHDTLVQYRFRQVENTAALAACQAQQAALDAAAKRAQEEMEVWRKRCLWACALFAALLLYSVLRLVLKMNFGVSLP